MRPSDLDATAATLAFFTLGLFGWGAQYILARGFYATRNTLTPAIVGTVLTFANLPLYWLLVRHYRHLGTGHGQLRRNPRVHRRTFSFARPAMQA